MALDDTPPAFEGPHIINLDAQQDSKISSVNLYPGRAEVTRAFRFDVKTGQNQVVMKGLPSVMEKESLRVDGHGKATIQEVSVTKIPVVPPTPATPKLIALRAEKKRIEDALRRCDTTLNALEHYLGTMHLSHTAPNQLEEVLAQYNRESEKIEERQTALRHQQLLAIDEQIENELKSSSSPFNRQLNLQATIGLFAPVTGEVTIVIVYGVISARWTPKYDLRVNVLNKEKPFTLVYQAGIAQNTGEDWVDTRVTLETISPSAGGTEPTLRPWRLSTAEPHRVIYTGGPGLRRSWSPPQEYIPERRREGRSRSRSRSPPMVVSARRRSRSPVARAHMGSPPPVQLYAGERRSRSRERYVSRRRHSRSRSPPPPVMVVQGADFTAQGTISATYLIPGKINVPSDGQLHNVTVAQLDLEAELSWVTVPKYDTKVYIKARAKNISEFTLLEGQANTYVDNSFVSKSKFPLVSPGETFHCPLGIDRAIRITYHPRIQKTSQSGTMFTQKSSSQLYSQRITVQNTKNSLVPRLRVFDQIPISENSIINVKLINPPLTVSSTPSLSKIGGLKSSRTSLDMKVRAQWAGADEATTTDALGKDGQLEWLFALQPQQMVNLSLDWEVAAPAGTSIYGL